MCFARTRCVARFVERERGFKAPLRRIPCLSKIGVSLVEDSHFQVEAVTEKMNWPWVSKRYGLLHMYSECWRYFPRERKCEDEIQKNFQAARTSVRLLKRSSASRQSLASRKLDWESIQEILSNYRVSQIFRVSQVWLFTFINRNFKTPWKAG